MTNPAELEHETHQQAPEDPVHPEALRFMGVRYTYPDGVEALKDIAFHVHPGEKVALLGPNGAGKSTLMLTSNGILEPTAGYIEIDGQRLNRKNLADARRFIGLVFQDPEDQLFMKTVFDDVAFGPRNAGLSSEEVTRRVSTSLEAVGLSGIESRSAIHLSFGQKKRVALATVLSLDAQMLILDEPSSNLDPRARREMIDLLQNLSSTMLIATHDMDLAWELCPRTIIMNDGHIIADGVTKKLLTHHETLTANGLEVPSYVRYCL